MKTTNTPLWAFLPIGLGIFIIGFLAGNITSTCEANECENLQANVIEATESKTESEAGTYYYLGEEDAPITMTEYTDYQCTFCQRYFFNTFSQIRDAFIATGKVRYTVKDLALSFHPKSRPAVYAARCAGEQNEYWEMHEKIFTYQNQWAYADNTDEVFSQYASDLGLDMPKFETCYKSGPAKFDKQIEADILEASKQGISGTPSFSINGEIIIGAQPFESFSSLIK